MLIVTGHLNRFDSVIEQPLTHASNLEDRLPAHYTFVRYHMLRGNLREALSYCSSILRNLGEDIPVDVNSELIQAEIVKTQQVLATNWKNDDLQGLSRLTEPMMIWMMKFMAHLVLLYIIIKEERAIYVGCLLIQRSVEYGWCSESSMGLYAFGRGLISVMKNVEEGCYW